MNSKRILIAEDETLIRMDLAEMLRENGYEVIGEATNGEEAIALANELKPDLAILDVKMPKLDGDRAKGILMQAMKLSEPEAFKWIQRTAMDKRVSMKVVAEAVIDPSRAQNW
ncbi:MAG: ANTAR domain-containing protein [Actinobacteria bacterium]|nr:ANTAR domain-containing protein [Actinomycetota bacterium]